MDYDGWCDPFGFANDIIEGDNFIKSLIRLVCSSLCIPLELLLSPSEMLKEKELKVMNDESCGYAKVILPLTEDDFINGHGEWIYVKVSSGDMKVIKRGELTGGSYTGTVAGLSVTYPFLSTGDIINFEMRGYKMPVAFLNNIQRTKEEEYEK
jgi:hypothetical protein